MEIDEQALSNPAEGFQVEDPLTVFKAFSSEEQRRWQNTDPNFDDARHQEAVALVLSRLKARLSTTGMERKATR